MSQSRPGTKVAAVVLLAGVLPWLLSFASHLVIGDARLVQEQLHEGVEVAGSCIALGVAMLLLLRLRRGLATPHLRCVAAALVGMGIIDGVPSLFPIDVAVSWSRHLAALVGGTLFALVWLPQPPAGARRCRLLVPAVAALAFAAAAVIVSRPEWLPSPWVAGEYSGLAIASNALGALGSLAAAAFFARRYLRDPKAEDLVFASLTTLFATAGLFYGYSHVWAVGWWVWHAARLVGYTVVLGGAHDVIVTLSEQMGRHTQDLESRVHERTAELEAANVALRETQSWLVQTERLGKVGGWAFDIDTGQQTWTETVYDIHEVDRSHQPSVQDGISFYTPASRPVITQAVQRAIEHGDPFDLDLELITAKGNLRSVHAIGRADLARGRVSGFFQDITERKQAEGAFRQLNAELDQRVRDRTAELEAANRELEAFSYSVSHDLRAPLRAIDGFGRILVEDYEDRLDPEGRRLLGVISGETRRMGQLIDDLLAFSRMGRQKMESARIDVAALARSVFADQAAQAPERDLRLDLKPLPTVRGDRAMIRVVLSNLISNAIKFTASRHPAVIEIGGRWEDRRTVYWVKDNGVGFDAKYADKLFGVFQRLHSREEFEGTGVGLALAQRILHRHGGRIWADGIVDGGAVFSISFPDRKDEEG